ncbi:MAG: type IV pilus biogenesis/stability protein PilW [Ottowia sp.]|nr:type IV pilus biogenesis/stability protein PilW [Ottowia sp.]
MTTATGLPWRRFFLLLAVAGLLVLGGCTTTGGDKYASAGGSAADVRHRAQTHLELAAGYLEHGQLQVAQSEAQIALQSDPSYADAYDLSGMVYMAMNDHEQARAQFQRAMTLKKDNASAMHNLAWLLCQDRNYAESDALFARALDAPNANRPQTLLARGVCQARAGNPAQAEATLMRAYELDAANPLTGYNLALLMFQRGDAERARFYIRRLNNSELANAESLWLGIRVERQLGDRVAVEQLAEQLRRRFPDSVELSAYEQGRFDE